MSESDGVRSMFRSGVHLWATIPGPPFTLKIGTEMGLTLAGTPCSVYTTTVNSGVGTVAAVAALAATLFWP